MFLVRVKEDNVPCKSTLDLGSGSWERNEKVNVLARFGIFDKLF